jgi:hypothetical protein
MRKDVGSSLDITVCFGDTTVLEDDDNFVHCLVRYHISNKCQTLFQSIFLSSSAHSSSP